MSKEKNMSKRNKIRTQTDLTWNKGRPQRWTWLQKGGKCTPLLSVNTDSNQGWQYGSSTPLKAHTDTLYRHINLRVVDTAVVEDKISAGKNHASFLGFQLKLDNVVVSWEGRENKDFPLVIRMFGNPMGNGAWSEKRVFFLTVWERGIFSPCSQWGCPHMEDTDHFSSALKIASVS